MQIQPLPQNGSHHKIILLGSEPAGRTVKAHKIVNGTKVELRRAIRRAQP